MNAGHVMATAMYRMAVCVLLRRRSAFRIPKLANPDNPVGRQLWISCGKLPKLGPIWRAKLLKLSCFVEPLRGYDEKTSIVCNCGMHWSFSNQLLLQRRVCSGQALQCGAAIRCKGVLVLSHHRRPKMLVRGQADAVESIAELAPVSI